jgi:hypothetical protein
VGASDSPGDRACSIGVGNAKWWAISDGDEAVAADFLAALEMGLEHILLMSSDEGLAGWVRVAGEDRRARVGPFHARRPTTLVRSVGLPGGATD